jgi:hypothetical protein
MSTVCVGQAFLRLALLALSSRLEAHRARCPITHTIEQGPTTDLNVDKEGTPGWAGGGGGGGNLYARLAAAAAFGMCLI